MDAKCANSRSVSGHDPAGRDRPDPAERETDCAVVPQARNKKSFLAAAGWSTAPAERHERRDSLLIAFSPGLFEDSHFLSYGQRHLLRHSSRFAGCALVPLSGTAR